MSFRSELKPKDPYVVSIEVKQLKKNGYAMLDGHPCQVKYIGRVGYNLRLLISGSDLFTNKEHAQSCFHLNKVNVPIVKITKYSLINIENNFTTLMDSEGNLREDLKLPSWEEKGDLTDKIINAFESGQDVAVLILEACGQEIIMDLKEDN